MLPENTDENANNTNTNVSHDPQRMIPLNNKDDQKDYAVSKEEEVAVIPEMIPVTLNNKVIVRIDSKNSVVQRRFFKITKIAQKPVNLKTIKQIGNTL